MSSKSTIRIEREIQFLNDNRLRMWVDSDIYDCIASINGPIGSLYEGGLFKLRINFPDNYPFKPPDI